MKKSSHLILGGARSGKSRFAEANAQKIAATHHYQLHYVATATAFDAEMQKRIAHHQALRQQSNLLPWHEHECPIQLTSLLSTFTSQDVVLIDCLTLWLNNLIFELGSQPDEALLKQKIDRFVAAVEQCDAQLLLVANEVGLGIIPMGEVSRLFVDHAGWLNQKLAERVNRVTFIAAGLAMPLKNSMDNQPDKDEVNSAGL
ncbi:bifunctional adenosylcobinamide kinase/adenosylcobinamide-phosphate guanylyltransferase [Psychromonas sp.]|uniref:bifunctional adenosylcobinamide kinase/adenosylcobinamide-phosphate guanylyltransferase n=1 Tax=Psychromonas sp. TaxID=1884585 RepID=UPI0035623B53